MSLLGNASLLKGMSVILYTEVEDGRDDLNRPQYREEPLEVANVIVGSPSEQEVLDTLNLTGRRAVYVLAIPKGDSNDWTDKTVEFFGEKFRTIGAPIQGMDEMIPLEWNKKVRCERING